MKLELHTERLLLTPLATTDLDLALELWTDPEVVKYVCDVMAEEEIRQEMSDAIKRGGNGGICIQRTTVAGSMQPISRLCS